MILSQNGKENYNSDPDNKALGPITNPDQGICSRLYFKVHPILYIRFYELVCPLNSCNDGRRKRTNYCTLFFRSLHFQITAESTQQEKGNANEIHIVFN